MRIAVDVTPLVPQWRRAGIARFTSELSTGLRRHEDVRVTSYSVAGKWCWMAPLVTRELMNLDLWLPRPAQRLYPQWAADVAESWQPPPSIDVVHGTNFVVPPRSRYARVLTIHDLSAWHEPVSNRDGAQGLVRPLAQRAVSEGAWVHVPSAFVADEVIDVLGVEPGRVEMIPHGLPPVTTPRPGKSPAGEPYILALGTLEKRKAYPLLIESFDMISADYPTLELIIAGPTGGGVDEIRSAIAHAKYKDRIRWHRWVPERSKTKLLHGATVLAYTSDYEGFGFPPLEAMQVGVPVVATTGGAIPEVCGKAARLVPPRDVDALARTLDLVLSDETIRADMVAEGFENVKRFSWRETISRMVDLYIRAMS